MILNSNQPDHTGLVAFYNKALLRLRW